MIFLQNSFNYETKKQIFFKLVFILLNFIMTNCLLAKTFASNCFNFSLDSLRYPYFL